MKARRARLVLALGAAVVLGAALMLGACAPEGGKGGNGGKGDPAGFLARHWADPLPAQGPVPAGFSALEASLAPQACGQCHPAQWQQWQASLHARAVGPGLLWQLHVMDQAEANRCLRCHAPLAEQKALLAQAMAWPARPAAAAPAYVPDDLALQGLVCAACHVRGHRRVGPLPRAAGAAASSAHGGFVATLAFSDSRFCAHCHQFPDDGPRTAGKLNEDTYEQWKASPFGGKRSCQDCHMPERRHQWRGIHDPETTRSAIDVVLQLRPAGARRFVAEAVVRNVGAGHHFPTYMVPKVELQFARVARDGSRAALGTQVIGWSVDTDLRHETADTRIPAGASRRFELGFEAPATALDWELELRVVVRPDEHYERTFAQSLAQAPRLPPAALAPLRAALAHARSTPYELLRLRQAPRIAN
ncbi:MAG: multiheme c-type cytochrome [Rubrivivax sp.]